MEAKILQILEKHKVHPFWIEFFDGQHMIQPVVLSVSRFLFFMSN